jgi:RNA polymerase Rpb4
MATMTSAGSEKCHIRCLVRQIHLHHSITPSTFDLSTVNHQPQTTAAPSIMSPSQQPRTSTTASPPFMLTNREVTEFLSSKIAGAAAAEKKRKRGIEPQNQWIQQRVCQYLETTPGITLSGDRQESFQQALIDFDLTALETMQILNFMPTELVELFLIVEELADRMNEERQQELLRLIASFRTDSGNDKDSLPSPIAKVKSET